MNDNKKRGTAFEREAVSWLRGNGWWVHFLSPDGRGAQPFDIIAMKHGYVMVGDCKTSASHLFPLSRLEWNQVYAFDSWLAHGGSEPQVIVKYKDEIILVPYCTLKEDGKVDLNEWTEEALKRRL